MANKPLRPRKKSKEKIHDAPENTIMDMVSNHSGGDCKDEIDEPTKCIHIYIVF